MAYKTFISYKYSESVQVRDCIIDALGDDAKFYNGEDGFTKDLSSLQASTIKRTLSNMIYPTSITILILSEHMTESEWINWEVQYSLRKKTRNDRQSQPNIIIPIITPINECNYTWADKDGSTSQRYEWKKIEKYLDTEIPIPFKINEFIHGLKNNPQFLNILVQEYSYRQLAIELTK